uniref:Putative glycine rich protein n=1 Tax=Ixodes ricinus TaxID=34613 RepID=A0A0K8R3M9_IXORI
MVTKAHGYYTQETLCEKGVSVLLAYSPGYEGYAGSMLADMIRKSANPNEVPNLIFRRSGYNEEMKNYLRKCNGSLDLEDPDIYQPEAPPPPAPPSRPEEPAPPEVPSFYFRNNEKLRKRVHQHHHPRQDLRSSHNQNHRSSRVQPPQQPQRHNSQMFRQRFRQKNRRSHPVQNR